HRLLPSLPEDKSGERLILLLARTSSFRLQRRARGNSRRTQERIPAAAAAGRSPPKHGGGGGGGVVLSPATDGHFQHVGRGGGIGARRRRGGEVEDTGLRGFHRRDAVVVRCRGRRRQDRGAPVLSLGDFSRPVRRRPARG
ncbi:unnamed protein product, partial [Ectocarpus sp. 13 AM-2016]